ncbi:MAG: DUF1538 domain-containing protein [Sphaerochaeta sp.]|jgi:hypothetical protein|nr:DUF1538 domain-containing protein [Sphaerochaeta sp.]
MELVKKLKDVLSSVLPIVVVVVICHLFVTPLPPGYFGNFLLGSLYVILGLTLFLLGVDISIVPVGQVIGSKVMEKRSALLLVVVGFVVGFVITYAEPNALVLASQVSLVNQAIQARKLLLMLSLGVGVYIALAFARLVLHIPLKYVLLVSYVVVFVLAFLNPETMVSIGFDSGGSATGPMAVPFIMALGIGAARVQSGSTEMDNFGFVGMQSIGAIIAVLVMGLLVPQGSSATVVPSYPSGHFLSMAGAQFQSVASSMLPLVAVVLFFQFTLLRMPRIQMTRVFVGMVYCFVGMSVFLLGANSGFMPVAFVLGKAMGSLSPAALIVLGLVLGALVVLAEPSVYVLVTQVEEISNNHITKRMMLTFLAAGVSLSVGLGLVKMVFGFSILWVLVPVYLISFILLFTGPGLFGAIAFDSGGVAAGPMAATFILPFFIGSSMVFKGDSFGIIGCVSMAPLITIQMLGVLYQRKLKKQGGGKI